jgi:hypothetical protein
MSQYSWTPRPESLEAECEVALVHYRLHGDRPVVWRIYPKVEAVDTEWATNVAADAEAVLRQAVDHAMPVDNG